MQCSRCVRGGKRHRGEAPLNAAARCRAHTKGLQPCHNRFVLGLAGIGQSVGVWTWCGIIRKQAALKSKRAQAAYHHQPAVSARQPRTRSCVVPVPATLGKTIRSRWRNAKDVDCVVRTEGGHEGSPAKDAPEAALGSGKDVGHRRTRHCGHPRSGAAENKPKLRLPEIRYEGRVAGASR